jgi:adenylosuccinate synthase
LRPDKFLEEVKTLEDSGFDTSLIRVSSNTHIITDFHSAEDGKDETIGTTKSGNGPAYRDKYARKGMRAIDMPELEPFLIDIYSELHKDSDSPVILFEGAQGFGLDIDWGDYPYVTSSHCTVGSALMNGVPPQAVRDVWGVAKIYETYVGKKEFHGKDDIFDEIRELGNEYGSTTGRPRQVNWLDMDMLETAIRVNGVSKLVINKMDILDQVGIWRLFEGLNLYEFETSKDIEFWIEDKSQAMGVEEIFFSRSPEHI